MTPWESLAFRPVEFPKVHELAIECLIEGIERLGLNAGDRLPFESQLAKELGLSLPSIREGLKVLREEGVIDVRKGKGGGVFLKSELLPVIVFSNYKYREGEVVDILIARRTVEAAITRLATLAADEQDFSMIRRSIKLMEAHIDNFERVIQADAMFHRAISHAAHNQTLARTIREIRRSLDAFLVTFATPRRDPKVTYDLCSRQLEAMQRRDTDAVIGVFDEHMRILEDDFARSIDAHANDLFAQSRSI